MDYSYEIRLRRGTDAQWSLKNPILSDGEPGYATDLNLYKIGNGIDRWTDLPWTTGLQGEAATVNVGDTITGEPGTGASVVNVGDENDAVLNFTIPEGLKGEPGTDGIDGKDSDLTYAVAEGRYERKSSLLATSAWHVDARFLTADGSGLEDLTGNGRDAIFGADAAAPIVLPHDGEDYIWVSIAPNNSLGLTSVTSELGLPAKIRLDFTYEADGVYNYWPLTLNNRIFFRARDGSLSGQCTTSENTNFALPTEYVMTPGERIIAELEWDTTDLIFRVNGVEIDRAAVAGIGTVDSTSLRYLGTSSETDPKDSYLFWSGSAWLGGEEVFRIDPSAVSSDMTTLVNKGTAPIEMKINRASSGFKTAVVDRPLVLFGGGQDMTASPQLSDMSGGTLLMAVREWGTDATRAYFDTKSSNSTTRTGVTLFRNLATLSGYYSNELGIVLGNSTGIITGQRNIGIRFQSGAAPELLLDGSVFPDGDLLGPGPMVFTETIKIGKTNSGAWPGAFELIGVAFFDHALTDEEIEQATLELLSVPHTEQPNPHPQYLPRVEAEHIYEQKLLTEASWRVDAGVLTTDGDGLADLSGNGRDAIFGAGAAAPIVLDHDGEDYLYIPMVGTTYGKVTPSANIAIPVDAVISFDVASDSAGVTNYPVYHSVTNNRLVVLVTGTEIRVQTYDGAVTHSMFWENALILGQRHKVVLSLTPDGTGGTLVVDGTSLGTQTWSEGFVRGEMAEVPTWVVVGTDSSRSFKVWGLDIAGMLILDPSQAAADYKTIPNTGSLGGNWTITRPGSGYKTAVVDRPLLLFGGAQHARVIGNYLPGAGTRIIAFKQWDNSGAPSAYTQLLSTSHTINATTRGFQLRIRTDAANAGRVWTYSQWTEGVSRNNSFGTGLLGQRWIAMVETPEKTRTLTDGGLVVEHIFSEPNVGDYGDRAALDSLTVGNSGGVGDYNPFSGEFIGAAIFDRVLTDTEIAQASQELLGVPHTKQPDPHPQYPLRTEVNTYPMEQVATWSALPPATTDDIGRRIHVTGLGDWLVAHCIADPTPRWAPTADSDTGWRDIAADLVDEDATVHTMLIRRTGSFVTLAVRALVTGGGNSSLYTCPTGFRPTGIYAVHGYFGAGSTFTPVPVTNAGSVNLLYLPATPTGNIGGTITYYTGDPWPTTLPGT